MNDYRNIPAELKNLKQWVACYSNSKVPMNVLTLKGASSSDASTWSSFDEAYDSVINYHIFDYLGFVFNGNDYIGIDIDKGYTDGFLNELSCDIMNHCQSYTEKSKSGRGIHIILKGKLPFEGKNNFEGVEIYQAKRFFVMTGNRILFSEIVENQDAVDYVVEKYFTNIEMPNNRNDSKVIYKTETVFEDGKVKIKYPPIVQGGRNLSLLSHGGTLRSIGYSDEQILSELRKVNQKACKPPLSDREVQSICRSVIKYKRGD